MKEDLAGIKVRSKYAIAYRIMKDDKTSMLVLPVNGKGLWSTLYGFIALAPDTRTIKGIASMSMPKHLDSGARSTIKIGSSSG